MEKGMEWEQKTLVNELKQGRELTKQLKNHLNPSLSSPETRQFLVEKILSSYEKALSMLNWSAIIVGGADSIRSSDVIKTGNTMLDLSPASSLAGSSPRSEGSSDQDCKGQYHKDVSKKRKTLPRWSEKVRVCSERGQDQGPHDDGYSWRKYGQKDILGAIHPRGYYRCTHRNVQGCLATKQVQRSDEDPTILEITYRGRHTCIQTSHLIPKIASPQEKQEPKPNKEQEMLISFGAGLKVKTEDLGNQIFPSFTFPSTPIESENVDGSIFSHSPIMGDPNNFVGSFSPAFISPATSESNYFSMSPNCHHMSSFGMGHNVHTCESDLTEIISATTSVTNSPMGDLDFSLGVMEFDSYFPFENPDFFP